MNSNLLKGSDKQYWHRYVPIYIEKLKNLKNCTNILEFGVFKGQSIQWLHDIFPNAAIYGSDILPVQPEWPTANNINYFHVDQGKPETILKLFKDINTKLDLIIEDGSHLPPHQRNCLVESLNHMNSGGIYILEDLHTSHPEHPNYNYQQSKSILNRFNKKTPNYISPLHLLLCLEHLLANEIELDKKLAEELSVNSLFTQEDIFFIYQKIESVEIYRRATLPHKCYSCQSTEFDYHNLKCKCGIPIYSNSDSMTAILTIK